MNRMDGRSEATPGGAWPWQLAPHNHLVSHKHNCGPTGHDSQLITSTPTACFQQQAQAPCQPRFASHSVSGPGHPASL